MNRATVNALLRRLADHAGLPTTGLAREKIRVWRLSGVERLRLPNGSTAVLKYAVRPFTDEHRVLADLAAQGMPVPAVRAAVVLDGMLGMILEDLGKPIRQPTEQDAAAAAVRLHAAAPPAWLNRLGEPALAALPGEALARLHQLRAAGRFTDADDLVELLTTLDRLALARAQDAERPPWGLCHGELHPSAIHIGRAGHRHVLDFAMAATGPGLLDLAAWSGLRRAANPPATRRLIECYVRLGGHPKALTDRGGLPVEYWALGWHRIQAAHWLLGCATSGIDPPSTDPRHLVVLRRQLTGAHYLLGA